MSPQKFIPPQQRQQNKHQHHSIGENHHQDSFRTQQAHKTHRHTTLQIIYLGLFFLLLTLTYSSFSTIITYIYQHHDGYQHLGPVLLMTNYGTFMFCNILAPFVKISYKKQLIIGAICYTINYALEIPVILDPFGIFLLVLGSVLGGLGAAIVWVSQGGFMTALFQKYDRPKDHHGRYFGLLNMIVFSNILLGSVVTTFGLGFLGNTEYFIILTVIGGLSVIFGIFFLQDVQQPQNPTKTYITFNQQEPESNSPTHQQNHSQQSQITTLKQKQSHSQQKTSHQPPSGGLIFRSDMNLLKSIKQMYTFSVKMRNFLPMIVTDGFILGFISSSATHLLPEDHYSQLEAGVFLILLGSGAIIGGFFSGFLTDKMSIMKVGKSSFIILSICMLLSVPLFIELIENFYYSYFLGFVWGFGWHYMDGWLWVTCSKIFGGKLQSFALNKFIHSMSFVMYQAALIIYGSDNSLLFIEYFFYFLVLLMVVSLLCLMREDKLKNQQKVEIEE